MALIAIVLFFTFATLLGIIWCIYAIHRVSSWVSCTGIITESSVETKWIQIGGPTRQHLIYEPRVRYRFEVAGEGYIGSDISYGKIFGSMKRSHMNPALIYPVGSEVTVYYHPEKILENALEKNLCSAFIILCILILNFLWIGTLAIYLLFN